MFEPDPHRMFIRDRFTWLAYALLAYFSYMQAVLGPLTPFLRATLNLNYTIVGMHLSALAIGSVMGGMAAERVLWWWGRGAVLWGGGAGMSLGGILLATALSPVITISGTFLIGICGVLVMIVGQAGLSDYHGRARAVALAEGSLASSLLASFAPLMVGGFEGAGIGWRGALFSVVGVWVVMAIWARHVPIPTRNHGPSLARYRDSPSRETLPALFWAYWLLLMMLVAVHWSIGLWSAEYFQSVAGLEAATASTLAWVFLSAIMIGRFAGMRLIRRTAPRRLLMIAICITLAGFPAFWLAQVVVFNVIGLFVMGLGVGNFYSLGLSLAIGTAPDIADTASARVSVGVGLAMLVVPQTLGSMADKVGLHIAFGIVLVALVLALLILGGIGLALRLEEDDLKKLWG